MFKTTNSNHFKKRKTCHMRVALCTSMLIACFCGFSGNVKLDKSPYSLQFSKAGNLCDLKINDKKLITDGAFIICEPISKEGKGVRVFSCNRSKNPSLNKTEITQTAEGDTDIITASGVLSGKNFYTENGFLHYSNVTTVDNSGSIKIEFELEFLETLKWDKFILATTFAPFPDTVTVAETFDSGAVKKGLFPKSFRRGSVKNIELNFPAKTVQLSSQAGSYWFVEDARTYGGKYVSLFMIPSWFKKGMLIPKGKKEKVELILRFQDTNKKSGSKTPVKASPKKTTATSPGTLLPIMDTYSSKKKHNNALYLADAVKKKWWNSNWQYRVPLIITEPIKKSRVNAPIAITYTLPSTVSADSVRVISAGMEEVPCQVKVLNKATNKVEIFFQCSLCENEVLPHYLYFGNPQAAPSEKWTALAAKEESTYWRVYNQRILVDFYKTPPFREFLIRKLELLGTDGRNRVKNFMNTGGTFGIPDNTFRLYSVAGGAIFKEIVYKSPDIELTLRIFNDSNRVFYSFKGAPGKTIKLRNYFLPAGDVLKDNAYYESKEGVKYFPLNGIGYNRRAYPLTKHIKEGWVCLQDDDGESIGQLFEKGETTVSINQTEYAQIVKSDMQLKSETITGAIVLTKGNFESVRNAYIDWKSPPEILIGNKQKMPTHQVKVPKFGHDFTNAIFPVFLPNYMPLNDDIDTVCNGIISDVIRKEGNTIFVWLRLNGVFWPSKLFKASKAESRFLPRLVELAHQNGIAVAAITGVNHPPKKIKNRLINPNGPAPGDSQFYVKVIREIAETGVDFIDIFDEYKCDVSSKQYKAAFKKKYGIPFPDKFSYKKLNQPENYNQVFHNIETINEQLRAIADEVRQSSNPNVLLSNASSPPNNLRAIGDGYHDLETQSGFLDMASTDPYTTDIRSLKYTCAICRGATGNKKPLHTFVGWAAYNESAADPDFYRRQTMLHTLMGANVFTWCGAGMADCELPKVADVMRKTIRLYNYTGLGDITTRSRPMPFMGVLRDRNAFLASIKKGECKARYSLTAYDNRINNVIQIKNVPADIIFSKHLTAETLNEYKIFVIPSQEDLPNSTATLIQDYVKNGGNVIIQGKAIANPILAQLCKLTPDSGQAYSQSLQGKNNFAKGKTLDVVDTFSNVKTTGATVLVTAKSTQPIMTEANYGKGKAVYIATNNMFPFLKELVTRLNGMLPLTIDSSLYSNILKIDQSYILAVYNANYMEQYSGTVKLNFLPKGDFKVVSINEGIILPIRNKAINIILPPQGIHFYSISADNLVKLPKFSRSAQPGCTLYSHKNDLTFLYQNKVKSKAKKAERTPKDDKFLYIGILKGPTGRFVSGWKGLKSAIKNDFGKYVKADFIADLKGDTINYYDAIVIPAISANNRPATLKKGWQQPLRNYVKKGGSVLLLHNSIGGRASVSEPVFPEIGRALNNSHLRKIKVTNSKLLTKSNAITRHCGWDRLNPGLDVIFSKSSLSKNDQINCAYVDHIEISPGSNGRVIARNVNANGISLTPAVVAGTVGSGKVVLCGLPLGVKHKKGTDFGAIESAPEDKEFALLINALFWLAKK